jgi:hypothetical protein
VKIIIVLLFTCEAFGCMKPFNKLALQVLAMNNIEAKESINCRLKKKEIIIPILNRPMKLYANKFTVKEDYDDIFNDDIYMYFLITEGGKVKLKLTAIYTGLDEDDSFFFSAQDRELISINNEFGDSVRDLAREIIIDFAILEADGDDVKLLKKLVSQAAFIAANAGYGSPQLNSAIVSFFGAVADLKHDSRLVTDTLILRGGNDKTVQEYTYKYKGERYFSSYHYFLNFRLVY